MQRNSRDENKTIKGGGRSEGWKGKLAKLRQKDLDALWLKKNDKDTCGFKMHTLVDAGCKLIRSVVVTPASVHDSQVLGPMVEGAGETRARLCTATALTASKRSRGCCRTRAW